MSEVNSPVNYLEQDRVAILTIANPPANGISHGVRAGLLAGLDRALADDGIDAVVLTGAGQDFCAGAELREFGTPAATRTPSLPSVIAAIESSPKPVVAAIHGNCLGGGLELALGCHWRVALADATLGLPEVQLGLMPGAGGTQRLPRAIGLQRALNMITLGERLPAEQFAGTDLIDAIVQAPVADAAAAFARAAVKDARPLRRLRELKVLAPGADAFLQFARSAVQAKNRFLPAPLAALEAVALSLDVPFDEALKRERAAFIALLNSPESRAMRHAFAVERQAAKVEGLPADAAPRPVERVGVIGAGTMGSGIAIALVQAGLPVVLLESSQQALDRGMASVRKHFDAAVERGRQSADAAAACVARVTPTLDYQAMADADVVIEAIFEDMDAKAEVFRRLDAVCKPGAILASNTSALDLDRIAAFTQRPDSVIGLHFFSPAHQMRLLEVIRGAATAPDVLATGLALARRLRKVAVVAGNADGFIGNRMLARYAAAANGLIDSGASPRQVDRALENFGFAMGVFRVGDLAGLDIGWATRKRRAQQDPGRDHAVFADRLCEAGRFGQKTGAGWYRYEAGSRRAEDDPEVAKMLDAWRSERGHVARKFGEREILERCIFALVNEGARILADGVAQRAGDIDAVYLNGYGFPRFRGGPMQYADEVGLPDVVRALRRIAAESPAEAEFWTPAPLLVEMAAQGRTFS